MLFEHAVRAIGFYEAQRKEALMAIENLRRAILSRGPNPPAPSQRVCPRIWSLADHFRGYAVSAPNKLCTSPNLLLAVAIIPVVIALRT